VSRSRPYIRPVETLWWARSPYLAYTLREATGVAVLGYALVLLAGVVCLATGERAYDVWLDFLKSPWSLSLHTWTWFRILPKTMPRLVIGGRVLPQIRITAGGVAVAAASFIFIVFVAVWTQP